MIRWDAVAIGVILVLAIIGPAAERYLERLHEQADAAERERED